MSLISIQCQAGTIQDLSKVLAKHPNAILLLGNACNIGVARFIRERSPRTKILLRAQADNWSLDAGVVDFAYRSMTIADPFQSAGLCDFLLPPNEPIVQNDIDARRLNTQMVQCAELYKSSGYATGAYNFSVGNPDYPLWAYLQEGILASDGWVFVHNYGAPNMQRDAENLSLRHRKMKALLNANVQSVLKVGITEAFIDLGIGRPPDGEPTQGGYRNLRNPTDDNTWHVRNLCTQLDWYEAELAKDPYVQFVTGFGYAMQEPWVTLGFDIANVDTDRAYFTNWMREGAWPTPTPPPNPEPEPPMPNTPITPAETIATMPFLVKRAVQLELGPSIFGEYDAEAANGDVYHCWVWQRGGLRVKDGDYGALENAVLFHPQTGEPMSEPLPWPNTGAITPVPPPNAKRLVTADVSQYGFRIESYIPAVGEAFFGLVAIGNIQSGPQVGTTSTMNAFNQVGGAAIGYKLTHAWDEANHRFEKHDSPSVGIVLGSGSYIPPSASDRFYVSADDGQSGASWPTPKGDVLVAGMPLGQHFQAVYTWQLMTG